MDGPYQMIIFYYFFHHKIIQFFQKIILGPTQLMWRHLYATPMNAKNPVQTTWIVAISNISRPEMLNSPYFVTTWKSAPPGSSEEPNAPWKGTTTSTISSLFPLKPIAAKNVRIIPNAGFGTGTPSITALPLCTVTCTEVVRVAQMNRFGTLHCRILVDLSGTLIWRIFWNWSGHNIKCAFSAESWRFDKLFFYLALFVKDFLCLI